MVNRSKWKIKEQPDEKEVRAFMAESGSSEVFASLCVQRGIKNLLDLKKMTEPDLSLLHDPFLFFGMEKTVERITEAVMEGQHITIYGDYDADGITSTALLLETLEMLGASVDYYIPDRFTEGYGPNPEAFQKVIDQGSRLIITCDNGVQGHEAVELAGSQGVDVIVTDHHELPEVLPEAYTIIHPDHPEGSYPFKELAGVGVSFKLAHALMEELPLESLDLVALGTVADLVSLTDENHIMVKYGMQALSETARPGLRAIYEESQTDHQHIDEVSIGFRIAPRLNASGRMADAEQAVQLLTTHSPEEARAGAAELERLNDERKIVTDQVLREVESHIDREAKVNVIAGEGFHEGVLGIAASRLVETTGKPSLVFNLDPDSQLAKGSGRSLGKFNLFKALDQYGGLFTKYGGHEMAAGMTLPAENLEELSEGLDQYITDHYDPEDISRLLEIDLKVEPEDFSLETVKEINSLEPYGTDHSAPLFLFENMQASNMRRIGSDQSHLKFQIEAGKELMDCIAFSLGHLTDYLGDDPALDIVGEVSINEWNGRRKLQIQAKDLRPADIQIIDKRSRHVPKLSFEDDRSAYVFFNPRFYEYIRSKHSSHQHFYLIDEGTQDDFSIAEERVVFVDMPANKEVIQKLLGQNTFSHVYAVFYSFEDVYMEGLASREDFAKVYKYIFTHEDIDYKKRDDLAGHLKMPVNLLNHIIFVFIEAGYVTISDGVLVKQDDIEQTDLTETKAFIQRQEQLHLEELLLYSSAKELSELLIHWSKGE